MKNIFSTKTFLPLLAWLGMSLFNGANAQNPYMPLWEHIPDGEPYVFEDPDKPGQYRVYVYGSHDNLKTMYCGRDQVVWSAPVNDLSNWRYDGIIFKVDKAPNGQALNEGGLADVLYAPDIVERVEKDGSKTYYLYPNNQGGGRNSMVCKAKRPDGPFEVINWSKETVWATDGVLAFDPGVFIDDDGRVYGYWGFEGSNGAELDPETMATVKPGTEIVKDMIPSCKQDEEFRFFEASSMRKIEDKYVFVYSRVTNEGEFGLPSTNYTLAYAYSDNPLGPFTYGGTIIDGRARELNEKGQVIPTATEKGNTHGSICQIDGKWWVFYHRQCGEIEYYRQAMVAPIEVTVEPGKGGKVTITEAEYTSEGFQTDGLNPLYRTPAGLACWYTGPKPMRQEYPNFYFSGSYVKATYPDDPGMDGSYSLNYSHCPVVNNVSGSIVGYKYFDFNKLQGKNNISLMLSLLPQGVDGEVTVMVDSPWTSKGGKAVGSFKLNKKMAQEMTDISVPLHDIQQLTGKHSLFFLFKSGTKNKSLCELHTLQFVAK